MTQHVPPDDSADPGGRDADFPDAELAEVDFAKADFAEVDCAGAYCPDADAIDDAFGIRGRPAAVPGSIGGAALGPDDKAPAGPVPQEGDPSSFLIGADAVRAFVAREWKRKLDYRLKKEVWSYSGSRVSILFEYEWHDAETDQWMLTHGEETWEIAADGLLRRVKATAQDVSLAELDRWVLPRPIVGPTPVD